MQEICTRNFAMPTRRLLFFCLGLLLAASLSACGPSRQPDVAAAPTRTPRPTFTPTPLPPQPTVVIPTATPAPVQSTGGQATGEQATGGDTASAAPTDTAAPQTARAVVTNNLANLRTGPDVAFALAGQVQRGTEFEIVGKNPAGDWWQVCCVDGQRAWIAAFLVDTTGPVDGVAVAANIPAPPAPTATPIPPPTNTPAPAQPTPTPAPSFRLNKGNFVEPRPNSNPVVSFFGVICKQVCPGGGAVGGYKLVVEGPAGRFETNFEPQMRHGDPGLASEFIYNAKLEIPGAPGGNYRAYVTDGGGNVVGEAWEYTASGDIRTFLPRWLEP